MNVRTLLVITAVGFLLPKPQLSATEATSPGAEEQLTKIEDDWVASYVKRDSSVAERITSDDFEFVGPDGNMVGKADYVKSIATGPTVFTAFTIGTIKVRVYGDAAVVTGLATISAKTGSKDESGNYAFSDTFVKQNGEWKVVSGQATAIAKH